MSRIQSVDRAAALLAGMADGQWHRLGRLAAGAGLAKTTAFNLVHALAETGLAEHDPATGAYRLGLRHLEYGRAVERRLDLLGRMRPVLLALCAETNETVNLAVPCPLDALIVESLEGRQNVRVTSYAGTRAPYHCTAVGRAMLAHRPAAERAAILSGRLAARTAHTLTRAPAIEAALAEVAATGFALEREEMEVGAACVAAPILASDGTLLGAISIAGPVARMDPATMGALGQLLLRRLKPGRAASARAA